MKSKRQGQDVRFEISQRRARFLRLIVDLEGGSWNSKHVQRAETLLLDLFELQVRIAKRLKIILRYKKYK